ncbi:MAG: response regulator transcription factor [Chloroflexi bacterium]|nr:response regulator transcription factor [Chloroflexota bacterium]
MGQQTTVLLADGHELMRESLANVLSRDSAVRVVGIAADGQAAITMAAAIHPDVVMLDLGLPRINGIEAGRHIRKAAPATGLILLSAHDRSDYMKEFLKDDSVGKAYLLKSNLSSTKDLVRTIHDVAVGRTVLDPAMVTKLTTMQNVRVGSKLKGLTNRELQVLALMAKAHSNKAVAEILYIQPRTVEHHISSILAKLGFNNDGDYHGRVHAVLTYLDAIGQLPIKPYEGSEVADREEEPRMAPRPIQPAPAFQPVSARFGAFMPRTAA